MLVYSPPKIEHTVTVFTDIDCAYCRKLHKNMDDYLSRGIEIRYLMFPRAGRNSASYIKAVSVWCAEDRKSALSLAKAGKAVKQVICEHPVQAHMALAEQMGISGAPVLLLDSGELIPSYLPADQLEAILDDRRAGKRP